MALEKSIFKVTYPRNVNAVGDTLNLWVSSSQTGSGDYYQKWVVKGMTIPSFGTNGDISEILEQVDRVGFKFKDHVDGLTRIDIVEDAEARSSAADSCGRSRSQIDQQAWWDSPYPHYASYVYTSNNVNSPFNGQGLWWFIPTGSALGGYSFKIDSSGKILAYCTCSSAGDGYPEMREPNSKNYFIAEVGERLAYPQHYFLQFKKDIPIPKGPVAGAFDSSSALQSVVLYPGIAENFYFSDFNVTSNNTEDNRSSKIFLSVDRLRSDANPTNIAYITGNLEPNIRTNLPEDVFANTQDSNYESSTWTVPRYEGSKNTAGNSQIPTAITVDRFSGSIYALSATSQSIASEDSYEGRKVQTLYRYKKYDPGATFVGSSTKYIKVLDRFVRLDPNAYNCPQDTIVRETTATMINSAGAITTNTSGGPLTVSVRYNINHAYGEGTLDVDISIADSAQSGSYEYDASYTTDFVSCDQEITTLYGQPNGTSVVGTDNVTYKIVDATFSPQSDTDDFTLGTNYILKDRAKGTGVDVVSSAKVLDIRKKQIYNTNSSGIIVGSKQI